MIGGTKTTGAVSNYIPRKYISIQPKPMKKIKEIRIYGGPIIIQNLVLEVVAKLNEIIKTVNLLSEAKK